MTGMASNTVGRVKVSPPSSRVPAVKPGSRVLANAPGSRAVEDLALELEGIVVEEDQTSDGENWMEVYSPKKNRFTCTISFDMDLNDLPPPSSSARKSTFAHRERRKSTARKRNSGAVTLRRGDTKFVMDVGKRYKHPRLPPPALTLPPVPPIPSTAGPSASSDTNSSAGMTTSTSANATSTTDATSPDTPDDFSDVDTSFDCTENSRVYRSRNTSMFHLRSKLANLNTGAATAAVSKTRPSPRAPRLRRRSKPVFAMPKTPVDFPDDDVFPMTPLSVRHANIHKTSPSPHLLSPPKASRTHRNRTTGLPHVVSPNHTRTAFVHVQPRVRVAAGPRPPPMPTSSSYLGATVPAPPVSVKKPSFTHAATTGSVPTVASSMGAVNTVNASLVNTTPRRPPRGPRPTPPRRSPPSRGLSLPTVAVSATPTKC